MDTIDHHHGLVIRKYRERNGLRRIDLAEKWPGKPVHPGYVEKIERGEKGIADQQTLRQLARVLVIPLWEFGLSDFNPFSPYDLPGKGTKMFAETLGAIESLIEQTWKIRRVLPISETVQYTKKLLTMFEFLKINTPPPTQLEKRFLTVYAQVQRLDAVTKIECKQYSEALESYYAMREIAKEAGNAGTLALAQMGIGTELERAGRKEEAIDILEEARNTSFNSSRQVAAVVNAYLARAYSSVGNEKAFLRAIDTAENIAINLGNAYGDGTDFVFHRLSGILAERSYGYLDIGKPDQTLAMKDRILNEIVINRNTWLYAWLPLDWAKAYLMKGEVEECIKWGIEFYHRAQLLESPHAVNSAYKLLNTLEEMGNGELESVGQFRGLLKGKVKQ